MIIFNLLITEYIITTIGKSCSNSPIIRWRPETSCSSSIYWSSQSWVWQQLGSLNRKFTNRQSKLTIGSWSKAPGFLYNYYCCNCWKKSSDQNNTFYFLILIVKTITGILHYDTCRTAGAIINYCWRVVSMIVNLDKNRTHNNFLKTSLIGS